MDSVSAKVVGTIGLVFGTVFLATSVVRLVRPEPDLVLVVLNVALGILWLGTGTWFWRFGLRRTKQRPVDRP
ncbi:hypothetical protein [Curtobacterium aetherium]|uniref:Uncharacterized protein n=1 Tax=Curtobacterium aetherium TaxID=2841594 RepID=A0ACD1E3A6_9MICO|nr:hypothetical protein [Curtobacterium sp. L6-1]QWS33247.1 hypothetical protein KM842_13535 [Curtobacterium sp. L6-1]